MRLHILDIYDSPYIPLCCAMKEYPPEYLIDKYILVEYQRDSSFDRDGIVYVKNYNKDTKTFESVGADIFFNCSWNEAGFRTDAIGGEESSLMKAFNPFWSLAKIQSTKYEEFGYNCDGRYMSKVLLI